MPAPRKLPDGDVLKALRQQGMTYEEIGEQYGVTAGAVYWQLANAGVVKTRPDHSKYLPWKVKTEHAHCRPATMLRYLSRREQGHTIPAVKERMLDKWLAEVKEADVVVCYGRDIPPNPASPTGGFYYSKRRPEDGDNLIRVAPEDVDHTSKVKKAPEPRTV
jgi:transcriptional regulator with XRE-family HTH domain